MIDKCKVGKDQWTEGFTNVTNDGELTLEQIEGHAWGDPPAHASYLVQAVYQLRRKPVGQLSAEELRVLLSQQTGVDAVIPYALNVLAGNPLAEGDYYPGDLLVAVLRLPAEYWQGHSEQARRTDQVVAPVTAAYLEDHSAPSDVILSAIAGFATWRQPDDV